MSTLFDIDAPDDVAPAMTERTMLDLIHARYNVKNGVAPRYVVAEHVGLDPMWPARILDAVVADMWHSSGFAVHGIEIKVSRSDLVRELADLSKSGSFCQHLDYFWLAVPDYRALRGLDIPQKWGVLTVADCAPLGVHLRQSRRAIRLRPATRNSYHLDPLPRRVQVAMLRATRKTYERKAEQ